LADTLAIGATLRLCDGISPGMIAGPSGSYCVIMPWRFTEAAEDDFRLARGAAHGQRL